MLHADYNQKTNTKNLKAWSAGPMNGAIKNAVLVEATLTDEHGEVFWAAATPSALSDAPPETIDYAYAGNWSAFKNKIKSR